jgi:hypothetical protein
MILQLDRTRKVVLLKWLKQGYIDTMDLPEAYKGYSYYEELMKQLPDLTDEDIDEIRAINHERANQRAKANQ